MKQKKLRPTIVNKFTFNAPIGRFFEYVENYYGDNGDDADDEVDQPQVPTVDELKKAILSTKKDGLWWSNRSWGVAFRIYQIAGYKGSYSDYVELVKDAKIDTGYECNYDAVQNLDSLRENERFQHLLLLRHRYEKLVCDSVCHYLRAFLTERLVNDLIRDLLRQRCIL